MKIISISILTLFLGFQSLAQESNLQNIRKLTFGGDNAEAYFSPDGSKLTMQVTNPKIGAACDQIFTLDLNQNNFSPQSLQLVSTGKGRTTCSYFMPDGQHILYASTHEANPSCPAPPKARADGKYVWAVYSDFDIYLADLKGNIVKRLTNSPGYDAEAVVSPDGKKIAFTSVRSGDLEIWMMNIDGTDLRQITNQLGYDGGCFFSHDSKKLVFRASRPKTQKDIDDYTSLLKEGLVTPTQMEIYTCNIDGSDLKQITHLGKANWAPFFHPSDKKIIFSSNHHSKRGYDFQLYMIDTDGENLRQITFQSEFNAFPMFSPDGKKLAFSSNRQQDAPRETNVFIADWVETDPAELVSYTNLKSHIDYLASDKLKGRLAGSKGEKKAAKYISKNFKKYGLKPLEGNKYTQPFSYQIQTNAKDPNSTKTKVEANNVIGFLDNGAKNTILIGGHYDHLGLNEHHNSTKPNSDGEIHNGADDNASGVAAVMELARIYATNRTTEPTNFIFACFSGEEDGLMGSKHLAENIKKTHPNLNLMVNMDMIGRLDSMNSLTVGGIGTSPLFGPLIEKNKPAGYQITIDSSGVGPTDHTSFYLKDIPVLNFFTGTHHDYHKPSDDAHLINIRGVHHITEYIQRVVNSLAAEPTIPFTKTANKTSRTAPKYKVTLGIMPDYQDYGDGLHIAGVMDGRTAHNAGIKDGDIITKIGKCPIKEVYSYMDCLATFNAGDETTVDLLRDGKKLTVKIKF